MENMLTPAQVAEKLQCSAATVRNMVAAGKLPSVTIGSGTKRKTYRIPEEALARVTGYHPVEAVEPPPKVNVVPLHPALVKALRRAGNS